MKITISYLPDEEKGARTVEEFVRVLFPGVKVRKSDRYPPYLHTYVTTKKPESPCDSRKNT